MIKQHYYRRYGIGIYDIEVKSKELSDAFVKKVLRKYCFYEVPASLSKESDYSKFPKAYLCYNTMDGEMVLGCSSFIPENDESEKRGFCTHNYVIPKNEKGIFIENSEKIIYAAGFYSDLSENKILDEVYDIEVEAKHDIDYSLPELLFELGIKGKTFKQLILACFTAVAQDKKIYIILDADSSLISKYARSILNYIYKGLPYEIRKKIGYITYANNIINKQYITLQFLSKAAVKKADIETGYLFDFNKNRFIIKGLEFTRHYYLDFVFDNIENEKLLKEFLVLAKKELDSNTKCDIYEYDKLAARFSGNDEEFIRITNEEIKNVKAELDRSKTKAKKLVKSSVLNKLVRFISRK